MFAIPWFTVPPIDLSGIGLGKISIFSLTTAASIIVVFWWYNHISDRGGNVRKKYIKGSIAAMVFGCYLGSYWGQVFLYHPEWLLNDPWVWLKIWRGGYSSVGGLYGALTGILIYTRINQVAFLPYLDRAWFAFTVGWIVARLGCVLIHDHPGMLTTLPFGVAFPDGIRHDLGLYEFLFTVFVIVPGMFWKTRKSWKTGTIVMILHFTYAPARFLLDFLRVGDATYLGLTPAQYGMIGMFAIGLFVWRMQKEEKGPLQPSLWGKTRIFYS